MSSKLGKTGEFNTGRQSYLKDWHLGYRLKKNTLLPMGVGCYGNIFPYIYAKVSIFW